MKLIPVIGVIFQHVSLWKDMSLILNVIQNLMNILGYKKKEENGEWTNIKEFGFMEVENSDLLVLILGYSQSFLVVIIVCEYMVRKVPAIYNLIKVTN